MHLQWLPCGWIVERSTKYSNILPKSALQMALVPWRLERKTSSHYGKIVLLQDSVARASTASLLNMCWWAWEVMWYSSFSIESSNHRILQVYLLKTFLAASLSCKPWYYLLGCLLIEVMTVHANKASCQSEMVIWSHGHAQWYCSPNHPL